MGQFKKDVISLLTGWNYVFLALTYRYVDMDKVNTGSDKTFLPDDTQHI